MATEKNETKVRVTNTTTRSLGLPQMEPYLPHNLGPGGNNVYEGHLEALDGNRVVGDWFERGFLELELNGEHDPEGPVAPESLEAYGEKGAIKLVKLEHDPTVVLKWRENDSRPAVIQALNERLAILRPNVHAPE